MPGACYEPLIEIFEATQGNRREGGAPGQRAARAAVSSGRAQRRTRRSSPPTTKPDSPPPDHALVQDSSKPSPHGEHGRDSASMDSPAVTPPVAPALDKTSGSSRSGPAPGLTLLQLEGELKRSMRVRGNAVELEGGMPPLDITKRIKVRGRAARVRATRGAQTPELDGGTPETDSGQVMLPGVEYSRLSKKGKIFKLPARRVKSVEKDWTCVDWPDIEYELDPDDETWLSENADALDLDADSLERLLDRLEKFTAHCGDDIQVPWERVGTLVTREVSTITVAAVVGWWQEKRSRHPAPLLRRLRPQTDFHDQDPDSCFRPQMPAPMSVRERTSSVDYRVIATGANQPLTQPAPPGPPALSRRKRERGRPGPGRVQRLSSSKIQIRPGCCITPPFLDLPVPGPKWCDDSASVLEKVSEMALASKRQAQRKKLEAEALKGSCDQPAIGRGQHKAARNSSDGYAGRKRAKALQHLNAGGLDLVVGATVSVKAVEFGEVHAKTEFGKKWRTATYTGIIVTMVSDAQFDGTDPRFQDGADVCMVKFDDGVFPVKPSMCTVLISPEQESGFERGFAMPNIHTDGGRISTGGSPSKRKADRRNADNDCDEQSVKRRKSGEHAGTDSNHDRDSEADNMHSRIFYPGDTVRCPKCKELMKAPQAAYALRCAGCSFAITPASIREDLGRTESGDDESDFGSYDRCRSGSHGQEQSQQRQDDTEKRVDKGGRSQPPPRPRASQMLSMLQQLQYQRARDAEEEAQQRITSCVRSVKVRKPHFKRWKVFKSVRLAAEAIGADRSDVTKCAKGKIAQLQGWICEYVRQEEAEIGDWSVPQDLQMPIKEASKPVQPIPCIGAGRQAEIHAENSSAESDSESESEQKSESDSDSESEQKSEPESEPESESDHDDADMEAEIICMVCGSTDDDEKLILCDGCNNAQHTFCCVPKLKKVPSGEFHCSDCRAKNKTTAKRRRPSAARRGVLARKKGTARWRRFDSLTAAGLGCGGVSISSISKCCHGRLEVAKGFEFKFPPADDD